mmetsp:Transcript_102310/g.329893  ORF Transcript_102310/g.329893 Transcript_102310/m.329893 type:complete len:304 (+) Transcript_102310:314-1225(+)
MPSTYLPALVLRILTALPTRMAGCRGLVPRLGSCSKVVLSAPETMRRSGEFQRRFFELCRPLCLKCTFTRSPSIVTTLPKNHVLVEELRTSTGAPKVRPAVVPLGCSTPTTCKILVQQRCLTQYCTLIQPVSLSTTTPLMNVSALSLRTVTGMPTATFSFACDAEELEVWLSRCHGRKSRVCIGSVSIVCSQATSANVSSVCMPWSSSMDSCVMHRVEINVPVVACALRRPAAGDSLSMIFVQKRSFFVDWAPTMSVVASCASVLRVSMADLPCTCTAVPLGILQFQSTQPRGRRVAWATSLH